MHGTYIKIRSLNRHLCGGRRGRNLGGGGGIGVNIVTTSQSNSTFELRRTVVT